ncbi:MAG: hypothetical protein KAS72_14475 [Phycisphaerales bacterium]|nr:hypothetical protein [Phycisphaerales bacterium]
MTTIPLAAVALACVCGGVPHGIPSASADPPPALCEEHAIRGGDAPDLTEESWPHCEASAAFPPADGQLDGFRNWCFGISHQRQLILGAGASGSGDSWRHMFRWDYAEWGPPRNMDLVLGRIPGNFSPLAHDVVQSTCPLIPADAQYEERPTSLVDRPVAAGAVDMITGQPLLREVDLELPFGGATFRVLRSYSEPTFFDRVGDWDWHEVAGNKNVPTHVPPGDQMWAWAGTGWMMGEAPLFLIDASYAYMNPTDDPDRRRCIFIPDAHHSIPFFQINESSAIRYEAPPRFDAALSHSNDVMRHPDTGDWILTNDGVLHGPREWYVWLYGRSVKYTITPIYDALPLVSQVDVDLDEDGEIDEDRLATFSVHTVPEEVSEPASSDPYGHYAHIARAYYGIPFYGLVTSIEDRDGNRVEFEYCDAERFADPNVEEYDWLAGSDCEPCAQNCAERGQIKSIRLRSGDTHEVEWTLFYIYREFERSSRYLELATQDGYDLVGAHQVDNHHAISRILVYEGDVPDPEGYTCYTFGGGTFFNVGAGGGGDTGEALAECLSIDAAEQFGFPPGWKYRLSYLYLDHWRGGAFTAIQRAQIRSFSCHYHFGEPRWGTPIDWDDAYCGHWPDDRTDITRGPRLLQVTRTDAGEESEDTDEQRHTVYRYAGNRRADRPDDVVLASVFSSESLARLRRDLAAEGGAAPVLTLNWPLELHAYDEYESIGGSEPEWVEREITGGRTLREYADLDLDGWQTVDAGVFWDPMGSTWNPGNPCNDHDGTTGYSGHTCEDEPGDDDYKRGTPCYDGGACFAYSQFYDELVTQYLAGVPNNFGSGWQPMCLEDGVCLVSSRVGNGEPRTQRIYRFLVMPHEHLPPLIDFGLGFNSVGDEWHELLYGVGPTTFTAQTWLTSAIWQVTEGNGRAGLLDVTLFRSILHEPFQYDRGVLYEDNPDTASPAESTLALWNRPTWVMVVDEYASVDDALAHAHHWNAVEYMDPGERPHTRRVVAMNAPGYILWDKTYDLATGSLSSASGMWEEFVWDWQVDPESLDWTACGRLLEHRTYGWSVAMTAALEANVSATPGDVTEGLVNVFDYAPTPDPENPSMQIGARGVREGTASDGVTYWQEQYIPHPWRPEMSQYELRWHEPVSALESYDAEAMSISDLGNLAGNPDVAVHAIRLDGEAVEGMLPEDLAVMGIDARAHVFPSTLVAPDGAGGSSGHPFTIQEVMRAASDSGVVSTWDGIGIAASPTDLVETSWGGALTVRENLGPDVVEFRCDLVRTNEYGQETVSIRDFDGNSLGDDVEAYLLGESDNETIDLPDATWLRRPSGGENAWTVRRYDHKRRLVELESSSGNGKVWTYAKREGDAIPDDVDANAEVVLETRTYDVAFSNPGELDRVLPTGEIRYALMGGDSSGGWHGGAMMETLVENQRATWVNPPQQDRPTGDEDYDVKLSVEIERDGSGGGISGVAVVSDSEDARRLEIQVGRWGTIERESSPDGTITRHVKDWLGRRQRVYIGTADTDPIWGGESGGGADDMIMTEFREYGEGVKNARLLTRIKHFRERPAEQYTDPASAVPFREDFHGYDVRMRDVYSIANRIDEGAAGDPPSAPQALSYRREYMDNLDRTRFVAEYAGGASPPSGVDPRGQSIGEPVPDAAQILAGGPIRLSETIYDGLDRVIETRTYDVSDPTGSSYLASRSYYDGEGRIRFTEEPGSGITQTEYDAFGRVKSVTTGHAFDVVNYLIEVSRIDNVYDVQERLIATHAWTRLADRPAGTTLDASNAVWETMLYFYDEEGRLTAEVDLGAGCVENQSDHPGTFVVPTTAGATPWDGPCAGTSAVHYEPQCVPGHINAPGYLPDHARVTIYCYDEDGRKQIQQAPDGTQTRYWYNGFGEIICEARNYDGTTPADSEAVERTAYEYDDAGRLVRIAAVLADHPYNPDMTINWSEPNMQLQITEIVYGAEVYAGDGNDASNNGGFISRVYFPDRTTGDSPGENPPPPDLEFTYYVDGSLRTRLDQRGVEFLHEYDIFARLMNTEVTTWPSAPVGDWPADVIRRVEYLYNDDGSLAWATAYDGLDAEANVVADNAFAYDARGNLTAESQEYGGVAVADSPTTIYEWDFSSAEVADNHDRLTSMTYPYERDLSHRRLDFSYGDSPESFEGAFDLITSITSDMGLGEIATYSYMGDGRRVGRTWNNSGVAGAPDPVAWLDTPAPVGDWTGYTHLDRFGRLKDLTYLRDDLMPEVVHSYSYARDEVGNILACLTRQLDLQQTGDRDNVSSYLYEYDGLHRLTRATRGTLDEAQFSDGALTMEDAVGTRRITWLLDSVGNWAKTVGMHAGRYEEEDNDGDGGFETPVDTFDYLVNFRNEMQVSYIYDQAGNLIADVDHYYCYDAWSRLIQVSDRGTLGQDENGVITGELGDWIVHYAYDAFGRQIATQRPWPGSPREVRVTRHHYDGTRRIQDVRIDPLEYTAPLGQAPISGSGGGPPTHVTYVANDYIYTPGYVDEFQLQIGSAGEVMHILQDGNHNVVALLDEYGDVLAQYIYDPYGTLVGIDHVASPDTDSALAHQGLFFDRLDADVTDAPLAADALGIYPNRNRTYHPTLGRFLQTDPNGTATTLLDGGAWRAGGTAMVGLDAFDAEALYGDGVNIYAYVAGNPRNGTDAAGLFGGLFVPGPTDYLGSMLQSLVANYSANLSWDVDWATDWGLPDEMHTRADDSWVTYAFAQGAYNASEIGIPFTDISVNPFDILGAFRYKDSKPGGRTGLHGHRHLHYLPMVRVFRQWRNVSGVKGLMMNKGLRGPNGDILRGADGRYLRPDVQMWYKGELHIWEIVNTNPVRDKLDKYKAILEHNGIPETRLVFH